MEKMLAIVVTTALIAMMGTIMIIELSKKLHDVSVLRNLFEDRSSDGRDTSYL
jgi:hypothetical protein